MLPRAASRVAALLALAACSTPEPPPPDVLLVVLDTVRADALSAYGAPRATSPQLDAVAAAGVRFTDVTAPGAWTWPVHASLFTGAEPWEHGARRVAASAEATALGDVFVSAPDPALPTLAERFAAQGYETLSVSGNGLLRPELGLTRGFSTAEVYDDRDDLVVARVAALLAQPSERPRFVFVNLLGPHLPYVLHPSSWTVGPAQQLAEAAATGGGPAAWLAPWLDPDGRTVRLNRVAPGLGRSAVGAYLVAQRDGAAPDAQALDAEQLQLLRDLYDSEVLATDRHLNALLTAWNAAGAASGRGPGVVAVTSDHGEHFGEDDQLDHGHALHPATVSVPLVVAAPGRIEGGRTVSQPVGLTRLHDTLVELAGLPGAAPADSLGPLLRGEDAAARPVLAAVWPDPGWARLDPRFGQIRRLYREGAARVEWADEALAEARVEGAGEAASAELKARAQAAFPPDPPIHPLGSPGAAREALEALGYLDP